MDLAFWGFSHWPFQRHQIRGSALIGTSQDEAYARLQFVIDERRRCGLLIGPAGTGKSCLCRRAADYSRRQGRMCVSVDAGGMGAAELIPQIADQMHADCRGESAIMIWSRIERQLANHGLVRQATVILVDNFDAANRECDQILRRLMNLADSLDSALTVLIFSRDATASSDLQDQIELTVELSGWTRDETARFVSGALRAAGTTRQIFIPDAISLIHNLTRGIPSDVIRVCDLALLAAMSDDCREVDAGLVRAAVAEFSPRHSPPPQKRESAALREIVSSAD